MLPIYWRVCAFGPLRVDFLQCIAAATNHDAAATSEDISLAALNHWGRLQADVLDACATQVTENGETRCFPFRPARIGGERCRHASGRVTRLSVLECANFL